jgi:glycosyltransferase involved in cell wall biosynthesis
MYQDNFERGIRGYVIKRALHNLRTWDVISTARVDYFLCNSLYTARRIKKTYGREADVLYPPVEVDQFSVQSKKEDYYFAVSRLVPYKRIDLIVSAFNAMPDKKLVVAGSGPDLDKIKAIAGKNVEILGYIPQDQLLKYMQGAKAFVFAALEDFGIVNVEAMACGTPVIALDHGGSAESVIDGVTGVHFSEQTEASMIDAVKRFEAKQDSFDPEVIRRHAELFSRTSFEQKIKMYIDEKAEDFFNRKKNRTQSEARII